MPRTSRFCAALCLAVFIYIPNHLLAQKRLVQPGTVDDSVRSVIAESRHPLANPAWDRGAVNPGTKLDRVLMLLGGSPQQEVDLETFLRNQQDKTSPDYHRWLTPEEFGRRFGAAPEDVQAVAAWLSSRGLTVTATATSRRWLEFSGTSAQVEKALQTMLRQYDVSGATHIANATDISVPTALAPVIRGIPSLHNFFKKPSLTSYRMATPNLDGTYTVLPDTTFNTPSGQIHALAPGDFAKIYDLGPLYGAIPALNGAGTSIAIVARSDVNFTDVFNFRQLTGLSGGGISNVLTSQPDPGIDTTTGDGVEAALDAEWSGAVAPGASIQVVVSASTVTSDGVDLSAAYAVDHNLAPVMSVSFGLCEADLGVAENAFYNALWQQAAAQGISVMVSSGDNGAAGCDFPVQPTPATRGLAVSGLASTPFNTAVGGTQFNDVANPSSFWAAQNGFGGVSALGYIPEITWNESCDPSARSCGTSSFVLFSASGGHSSLYPMPLWQLGFNADTQRDIPDVSLSAAAHDGYVICFNLSCNSTTPQVGIVGGTSASSPSFAGMMAIVNQVVGRQGLANPQLYNLFKQPGALCDSSSRINPTAPPPGNCIFNDVTGGNNSVPGQPGFSATIGYDLAVGLGSVNAANLVNAWKAATLSTTTITMTAVPGPTISGVHGDLQGLVINVAGPAAPPPNGNVSLVQSGIGVPVAGVEVIGAFNSNTATFNGGTRSLPGGSYSLIAHFAGSELYLPSDSAPISVTISPEPSSVNLHLFTTSGKGIPVETATFPYGSTMILHADVVPASGQGIATGTVNFNETTAGFSLRSGQVNLKNEAEVIVQPQQIVPAPLTVGAHTVQASYTGDASFNSSNSAPVAVTITKATPVVSFGPTNSFVSTQQSALTVVVNRTGNIFPTGTVQLSEAGVPLGGPITLDPQGQAVTQLTFATEGQHIVDANYSGDSTYNAASSGFLTMVLPPFHFNGNTAAVVRAGQSATFNLTLAASNSPSTFVGTVSMACLTPPPGFTCSISPASASFTPDTPVPVTVTVGTSLNANLHPLHRPHWPYELTGVVATLLVGMGRKRKQYLASILLIFVLLGANSCGGGGSTGGQVFVPPSFAAVTISATSGTHESATVLTLTINH